MSTQPATIEKPAHVDDARMRHIGDADLFAALDLSRPGLAAVRAAAERADWPAAYQAWAAYFAARERPLPVFNLQGYANLPDELRQARGGPVQQAALKLGAEPFDFVAPRGRSALYGLHYMLWLQPLAQAYALDGRDEHIRAFVGLFNRWYETRDQVVSEIASLDVIWYTLGLAIRSQVFVSAYSAFRQSPLLDAQTHARLLKSCLGASRWLHEEHDRFRYGNWQLTGVSSLYELGVFWPEFREARAWRENAWPRLLEHLELDVYPDGGHSERSQSYHHHVLSCFSRVASVAELNGQPALQDQPRFHAMYRWLLEHCTPLGSSTNFNDSHLVWVGVWAVQGAVLCADPQLKWLAEQFGSPDEIAWTLAGLSNRPGGLSAAQAYAQLSCTMPALASTLLPTSKFAIMRTGLAPDDLYLAVNYGPLVGHEYESHSHLDALSFVCVGYGAPLAIDAGLPLTSYDDPLYTTWIRRATAHNMLVVDEADPDENDKEGRLLFWSTSPVMDVFEAEHAGYQSRGVRHRRAILFIKGEYWIVFDELRQSGSHRFDWRLFTPQPFNIANGRLEPAAAPGLLVLPVLPTAGSRLETAHGTLVVSGPRAFLGTGEFRDVSGLSHILESDQPRTAYLHVLYPIQDQRQSAAVQAGPMPLGSGAGEAALIQSAKGQDVFFIRDSAAPSASAIKLNGWETDARSRWGRARDPWAVFEARYLRQAGVPLVESSAELKSLCCRPDETGWAGEVEVEMRTVLTLHTGWPAAQLFLNGVLLPETAIAGPLVRWLMPGQGRYTYRIVRAY